jgi:hypothetical protein
VRKLRLTTLTEITGHPPYLQASRQLAVAVAVDFLWAAIPVDLVVALAMRDSRLAAQVRQDKVLQAATPF